MKTVSDTITVRVGNFADKYEYSYLDWQYVEMVLIRSTSCCLEVCSETL